MPKITDDQLDDQARDVLFNMMKKVKPTREELKQGAIAASVFSTINRRQQTSGAREATALIYARELISDPVKRHEYLRAALPSSPFVKALPQNADTSS
jgi:hypothetical protein